MIFFASFAALGLIGREIHREAPPIPTRVVTSDGAVIFMEADIQAGRMAWQSMGGQQIGSIWGHGGYLAPNWSADWLHREATALIDRWSSELFGFPYDAVTADEQAVVLARVKREMRANGYNPETGEIVVSPERGAVIRALVEH